jgi:branched-subunit amino acid transport protein
MSIWLVLIFGGLLTYATRFSFILLFDYIETPNWLQRALKFVPPAVLMALIFPELLLHNGALDISLSNLRLIAGLAAILVAWHTRNIWLTILIGMISLVALEALL